MSETLDLGTLSYTVNLESEDFSTGMDKISKYLQGLQENTSSADKENTNFNNNIKALMTSFQSMGTDLENLDQKLRKWTEDNKENVSQIELNNKVIDNNKTKIRELENEMKLTTEILNRVKTTFNENSSEYKNVENILIQLEGQYKKLGDENKNLEKSSNVSVFEKLKSAILDTGKSTDELDSKAEKSGGILTKAFGGIKSAVSSAASSIMSGVGIDEMTKEAEENDKSLSKMDKTLKETGNSAGMSKAQLLSLAESQGRLTEYSKSTNLESENLLLTFKNIGSKVFPDALKSVNNISAALGKDTKTSAQELGKALNDPINGVKSLTDMGVKFTKSEQDQITSMTKAGNIAGAQSIMLKELKNKYGDAAEAAGKTFPGQLKILQNQLNETGASVIQKLLPYLTQLLNFINSNIPKIQPIVTKVATGIANAFKVLTPIILGIGNDIIKIAKNIFPQLNSASGGLSKSLLSLTKGGLTTLKTILDWMAKHGTATKVAIAAIGTAFGTWKTVSKSVKTINDAKKAIDNTKTAAKNAKDAIKLLGDGFSKVGGNIKNGASALADFGKKCGSVLVDAAKLTAELARQAAKWMANKIAMAASAVATTASTVATNLMAMAQRALNLVLSANPIGIVITVLAALAAALIAAYNKSSTFRNGVNSAFNSIKETIGEVVSWVVDKVKDIAELPGKALNWGKDMIKGFVDGIKSGFNALGDAIGWIAKKISGLLHHSTPDEGPMKDDDKWMPDFMDNLAVGIESNKHKVTKAIKNLASDMQMGLKVNPVVPGVLASQSIQNIASNAGNKSMEADGITFNFDHVTINGYNDLKKVMRDAYNIHQDYSRARGGI